MLGNRWDNPASDPCSSEERFLCLGHGEVNNREESTRTTESESGRPPNRVVAGKGLG